MLKIPLQRLKIKRLEINLLFGVALILISACTQETDNSANVEYRDIKWEDLEPYDQKERDLVLRMQAEAVQNEEPVDEMYSEYTDFKDLDEMLDSQVPPQAFSVGFVAEMDGQKIRLPGFIVPVEFESENLVTEFFLVPYFGACFHEPPPPPNQTIYVVSEKPLKYESIYDPVWVMGTIKTEQKGNDIATAEYTLDLHSTEPFRVGEYQ